MNIRKYLVLAIGGGATVAAAAVLAFFLARYASEYGSINAELDAANRKLAALGGKERFPNEENVARAEENLRRMEAFFKESMDGFLEMQRKIAPMEPARFPPALQRSVVALNQSAVSNGVAIPNRFLYGFDRYARGQPPAKGDVARLLRQIHAVESVAHVLFEARIRGLVAIERHVFEDERPKPAEEDMGIEEASDLRAPAAGYVVDRFGLFEKERLVVTFVARESSLWQILNELPKLSLFCVVADLEVANEAAKPVQVNPADGSRVAAPAGGGGMDGEFDVAAVAAPAAPAAPAATGGPVPRPPRHEERTVAGIAEPLKVRLAIDVYTFRKPASAELAEEAQP